MKYMAAILTVLAATSAHARSDESVSSQSQMQIQTNRMQFAEDDGRTPLVSGEIFPPAEEYEPFVFTKDSKAIITIDVCKSEDGLEKCDLVHTHTITGIHEFPITFETKSKFTGRCQKESKCFVNVEVLSNGREEQTGDVQSGAPVMIPEVPMTGLKVGTLPIVVD